jgi:anti-anti-sigma factor
MVRFRPSAESISGYDRGVAPDLGDPVHIAPEVTVMPLELQQPNPRTAGQMGTTARHRAADLQPAPRARTAGRCTCSTTTTTSPDGESVVVFSVSGELDLATIGFLATALSAVRRQKPDHLVIDLAELTFCSARGLALLTDTGAAAVRDGTQFAIGAASPLMILCWDRCWPRAGLPTQFPTTAAAVRAFVGRVGGDDLGYAGETGAERRAEALAEHPGQQDET